VSDIFTNFYANFIVCAHKKQFMRTIEERMREPYHCTAEARFFLFYLTNSTLYVYRLYRKLIVIKCFNNFILQTRYFCFQQYVLCVNILGFFSSEMLYVLKGS
jgi:hypothetical protein